ncbi:MAG: deoxyribose-phosphate aldolase [Betaproteobacteria bacterium]|nr:MAG: deoxyribose-phosphate aldolase [Betaproteobacteria bacterium]
MTRVELARIIDHSVLKPEATEVDIRAGAELVRSLQIGFFCVQPSWVKRAATLLVGAKARIVTVIGFPHGCDRFEAKARAAALAVEDGTAEIDMVMNFGALKSGLIDEVTVDVRAVIRAVGAVPVKVILETAALTENEKLLACRIARDAGAAFVKTSTGFHPSGGASVDDVSLLRSAVGPTVGVKASGGIRSLADALAMLDAGANRIGTSASQAIISAL